MQYLLSHLASLMAETPAPAIPNPVAEAPPGLEGPAQTVLNWIKWGGMVGGVAGFMILGIMMITGAGRNRSALAINGASGLPWVVLGLTIVMSASSLVAAFLS